MKLTEQKWWDQIIRDAAEYRSSEYIAGYRAGVRDERRANEDKQKRSD